MCPIRKIAKILWPVFVVIAVILISAVLAVQTSAVQGRIVREVEERFLSKLDADVSFSKIHFRPFNAIVIRDLLIIDKNPQAPSDSLMAVLREEHGADYEYTPCDTVLNVRYIVAEFSLRGLFKKEGIHLSRALVRDGRVNLVIEQKDTITNLQRVFGLERSNGEVKERTGDMFDLRNAQLKNMSYSMHIIRDKHPVYKGGINWSDLYASGINAEAKNVKMSNGILSGRLEHLEFREKSGLRIDDISGNAAIGRGQALVEDIHVADSLSDVNLRYFSLSFRKPKDFRDFNEKIQLDGKLLPSTASTRTVSYFVPSLAGMDLLINANGEIHGTVDSFDLRSINLSTADNGFSTTIYGNVSGITADKPLVLDMHIKDCTTDTKGIDQLVTDVTGKSPGLIKKVPNIKALLNASLRGPLDRLKVSADLNSNAGYVRTKLDVLDLTKKNAPLLIGGNVETTDLDLGKFIKTDLIHELSLETRLNAKLRGKNGPELAIDTLRINRLNLKGYDYTKILATGDLSKQQFNGRIISQDPNLNFLFQGIFTFSPKTQNAVYQFYANVGHADLHELKLDLRENATLSLQTNANFNRTGSGMLLGNINIRNVRLTAEDEIHDIGDINLTSRSTTNEYRINLTSKIANGQFVGSAPVNDFVRDLMAITAKRELPSLFEDAQYKWAGETYKLNFIFEDARGISGFIKPGLYIDNDTDLALDIDREGNLDAYLRSHRIALKDKYIKDFELKVDNKNDRISGKLSCDDINVSAIQFLDNTVEFLAEDDHIGLGIVCNGDQNSATSGEIFARGDLSRDMAGLGVHVDVLPSAFTFNESEWNIMPACIDLKGKDFGIQDLVISSGDQSITVDGGLSSEHPDTLSVRLDKFSLSVANAFLGQQFDLKGDATGEAVLISYAEQKNKGILIDLVSEGTQVSGADLGNVEVESIWDEVLNRFNLSAGNEKSFSINGTYTPSMKDADIDVHLHEFNLGVAKPVLSSIFSDMVGYVSGDVHLYGPLNKLNIESTDGKIRNAVIILDYTKVPYRLDGPFHVNEYGLHFDNITIRDMYNGSGSVNGSVYYDHFKDLGVDLGIKVTNSMLINIPESDNDGFYGKITGSGNVGIHGPLSQITLDIDATTTSGGDFHIPATSSGKDSNAELLTFKEPEKVVVVDHYEEMMKKYESKSKTATDIIVNLKARANQNVEAFLEIDKSGSNGLNGRGNGNFDIEVRPSRGIFNLKGDYTLTSGTFLYNAFNLAKREFEIQDGSSVKFNGAIMDSDLDINAIYRTKAPLSRLISDTTSVNSRRTVECGISITDKLSNPSLGFSIDIPDLEPSVKAQVENALSTEDKVQKQFIALLLSNNFLPDEQSGITNESTSLIYSSVTSVFTNQLNNILQKLNIPLDFDMRYQQNQRGNDIFDVAVSTQLFNNRVIVNGNIGNRQYTTGNSNSDVVGDLDIEIKLDKPGALRLNLFSHSADQYTNYLDNSQRNGVGITYQQEFNRFVEMLRYTFAGKEKKEKINEEELEKAASEPVKVMSVDEDGGLTIILSK